MGLNFGRDTLVSLYWRHYGWHLANLARAEIGACHLYNRHEEIHLRSRRTAITDQETHLELLHRERRQQPQRVLLQILFPKVH
jgi:hypothetical protein